MQVRRCDVYDVLNKTVVGFSDIRLQLSRCQTDSFTSPTTALTRRTVALLLTLMKLSVRDTNGMYGCAITYNVWYSALMYVLIREHLKVK